MNALGDYTHLEKRSVALKRQLTLVQNRINKIRKDNIDNDLLELQDRLQTAFKEKSTDLKNSIIKQKEEQKIINATDNKIMQKENSKETDEIKLTETDIEELIRLRKNILSQINRANKNKTIDRTNINKLLKNIENFYKLIGKTNSYTKIENLDMLTGIRESIQAISINQVEKSTINGIWGEKLVALCDDAIEQLTENTLETLLDVSKENIKGAETARFQVDKKQIAHSEETTFNKKIFEAHSSQNKVDVNIKINEKPLNISVKAYGVKNGSFRVHLQDITLLYSLLAANRHYANHWLILHTSNNQIPENFDNGLIRQMQYEALVSGNLLKKGASLADTFVAIDPNTGKIYAKSTADILDSVATANETNDVQFFFDPNIESLKLNSDKRIKNGNIRRAKLLNQAHQLKISASLKVKPLEPLQTTNIDKSKK